MKKGKRRKNTTPEIINLKKGMPREKIKKNTPPEMTVGDILGESSVYGFSTGVSYLKNNKCIFETKDAPLLTISKEIFLILSQLLEEISKKEWIIYLMGVKTTEGFMLDEFLWTEQRTNQTVSQPMKDKHSYSYTDDARQMYATENGLKIDQCVAGVLHSHHAIPPSPSEKDWEQSCVSGDFAVIINNDWKYTAWAKKELPCGSWIIQETSLKVPQADMIDISTFCKIKSSNHKLETEISVIYCDLEKKQIDIELCKNIEKIEPISPSCFPTAPGVLNSNINSVSDFRFGYAPREKRDDETWNEYRLRVANLEHKDREKRFRKAEQEEQKWKEKEERDMRALFPYRKYEKE